MVYKLASVERSPISGKKWRANFLDADTGKRKHTDFGAEGMDDYTITHDDAQRERYRTRHKKDLDTGDYTRAGYLSYYLLWNKKTLTASIADFRRRFH